ncbi:MAG: calcium-binding protein [Selenomonadaceae bacterium]|nr:calcium-binding protein [Selenomonadaceae bacterium]
MATPQTIIKNFMNTLDNTSASGGSALTEAVSAVSNFTSWTELTKTMIADCKKYNGDYAGFLKDMCDIVLENEDTGAITGSDAGGATTKTAESVILEEGTLRYPDLNVFTVQGLEVTVPKLSTLTESQKFIVGALYTWWIDKSLTLINDSFGINFNETGTTVKKIDFTFYDKSDGQMAVTSYSTTQKCTELHIQINMHYYDSIDTSNPNGLGSGEALTYLDRTIAHEMVHAVMAANFDYFNDLPTIFKEGSAEVLHGIDDKRLTNIKNLALDSSALQSAINGSGTNTYAAGYMLLRYLAKQAANNRNPSDSVSGGSSSSSTTTNNDSDEDDTSTTTSTGSTVISGSTLIVRDDYPDDIWLGETDLINNKPSKHANSDIVTLDATQLTNTLILTGNDNNNVIKSGSSGGSIWGGTGGDDTLIGGDSRDMFWYANGNGTDIVKNFTAGTSKTSDVVTIIDNFEVSRVGNDLALITGDGNALMVSLESNINEAIQYSSDGVNVIGVKVGNTDSGNNFTYENNLYFLGGKGSDTITIYDSTGDTTIFLTDNRFNNINILDAQNSDKKNILAGNNLDNTILAGSGDTSLWGGNSNSNDVLFGGGGADMFWFGIGEGEDVINNVNANDTVNLYNVNLSDIAAATDYQTGLQIKLSSGTLNVDGVETPKFLLSDGKSYRYDRENATWYISS